MLLWIENWGRDMRQAARGLGKRPMFALTAVASLAIGIGAVTSLFSVVDAVVLRPVALPDARELVFIEEYKKGVQSGSNGKRLKDWQALSSFAAATGFYGEGLVWKGPAGAESILGLRVFSGAVNTFKLTAAIGRTFTAQEERGELVAMLSEGFWRRRFNGDAKALDQTVELDSKAYRIVGVLPAGLAIDGDADAWLPADRALQEGNRKAGYLGVVARLRPGVTRQQAQAEADTVAARLRGEYPDTDAGLRAALLSLQDQVSKDARTPLLVLLGVVSCVLLMIAVNLSALLLARAGERQRESSLRAALGATPGSLIRLYLAETMLLAFVGAGLGLLLALSGVDLLKAFLPGEIPRLADARVDWRVLGLGVALAFAVSLLAGLAPAWLAARSSSLRDEGRTTGSREGLWLRHAFVVGEIALGILLVTTAARMAETFVELSQRSRAFQTEQKIAVTVPFSWTTDGDRIHAFNKAALERFAALPGATQVGLADRLPLGGGTQSGDMEIDGAAAQASGSAYGGKRAVSAGYFNALGVPLLRGRMFSDRRGRREAVVNESFVRKLLNGADPLGRKVRMKGDDAWLDIVGLAANIRKSAAQSEAEPEIYLLHEDVFWPVSNFVIRSTAPLSALGPMVRKEVGALDPTVVIDRLSTLDDALGQATAAPRVRSYLVGGFALLALLLAAIGIHGLFAADVAARWKEFGVRLALGGTVPGLRGMLLTRAARLLGAGCLLGIAAVLATSKLLEAAVEGLQPARAATGFVVAAPVLLAAAAAIWWPLRRLAKVDPASALRHN